MSIEAMKQALEALEYHQEQTRPIHKTQEVITALRQAIEEAEKQEPYCWVQSKLNQGLFYKEKPRRIHTIPLYTAPPQAMNQEPQYDRVATIHIRYGTALVDCPCCANKLTITFTDPPRKEWVGLTGEELAQLTIDNAGYPTLLTASIEAKLKEKNS